MAILRYIVGILDIPDYSFVFGEFAHGEGIGEYVKENVSGLG